MLSAISAIRLSARLLRYVGLQRKQWVCVDARITETYSEGRLSDTDLGRQDEPALGVFGQISAIALFDVMALRMLGVTRTA